MKEERLLEYAIGKFEEEKYDEALEAFILAYCKGIEKEWILETVYQCYMEGNQQEFRKAYADSAGDKVPYDDCILDFIPYREGEYYIFDKELKSFLGIFSVSAFSNEKPDALFERAEFSPAALELDWNWNKRKSVLSEAKHRKIYLVAHDIKRCISFWKVPELYEYRKNISIFSKYTDLQEFFHHHTEEYLPRIFFGTDAGRAEFARILEEEHQYRLTSEGRNTDYVLLTIAIPTFNRGNLLLKRLQNLCSMVYDSEIEIAISKNGIELYQEEYKKAGRSAKTDARIRYYDHEKDLVYVENWRYAAGMAHGKYILFVSDEDDVDVQALEHYLKILAENPEVSLVRARSTFQNAYIDQRRYAKKGLDAFDHMFLGQNYLSGLIVRREDFDQENMVRLDQFSDNEFYRHYPHEWWCALLSRRGDYMEEPVVLIREGETAFQKKEDSESGEKKQGLPSYATYATYESRLKQLLGMVDFLHWFAEEDQEWAAVGLYWAIRKTERLFVLARQYKYDLEHLGEQIHKFGQIVIEAVDEFGFEERFRGRLLITLKESCIRILEKDEQLRAEEA